MGARPPRLPSNLTPLHGFTSPLGGEIKAVAFQGKGPPGPYPSK